MKLVQVDGVVYVGDSEIAQKREKMEFAVAEAERLKNEAMEQLAQLHRGGLSGSSLEMMDKIFKNSGKLDCVKFVKQLAGAFGHRVTLMDAKLFVEQYAEMRNVKFQQIPF